MKSIIKWVIFIPVCILSSVLMLFTALSSNGMFFGFTANTAAETVIFAVLGILVLFFIISLFDRTTSPVHLLRKNAFCGVTAIITAFLFAASAALGFTSMVREGIVDVMGIVTGAFTLVTAVALLFIALNHLTGSNTPKNISILYLVVPLWCAVHLIDRFLQNTATPVAPYESLDLVLFVTMALFSIYAMMIHALIPGRNAVKSAITMGFPAVISAFAYSITEIVKLINADAEIVAYIPAAGYAFLGLYVLGFTAELSFCSKTTEEIILSYPDEEALESEEASEDAETPSNELSENDLDFSDEPAEIEALEETAFDDNENCEQEAFRAAEALTARTACDADDALDELLKSAKEKDTKNRKSDNETLRGETMIIVGENEQIEATHKSVEPTLTGKTAREAVLFDDDFIISLNDTEDDSDVISETAEIKPAETESSPIVTDVENDESDSFSSRMDEIDKLILSIQGGDIDNESPEDKE